MHRPTSTLGTTSSRTLTVIIPTLNEETELEQTLELLKTRAEQRPRIIVVDGGSTDRTGQIARRHGAIFRVVRGGRGAQLRHGVSLTPHQNHDHNLLFLHADTHVPTRYDKAISTTLCEPFTSAGAFSLSIRNATWNLRIVQWGANIRSRIFQRPYGDQGLFMRRSTLDSIGGYPAQSFLDDYEIVLRLSRHGRIRIAHCGPIQTSGRRWQKLGILRTTLLNQCIIAGYHFGIPIDRLSQWYRGAIRRRHR